MKRMLLFCGFLLVLTLALGGLAGAQTIKIGLIGTLSGNEKFVGEWQQNEFEIAISEANARGGILGKRIVPVIADDRLDPAEASRVAQRLIRQEGVKLIVGTPFSKVTIPISEVCQREGAVLVSPQATNPRVTVADGKRKTYIFRACFIDPFQGQVMARFALKDLRKKTAAVLYTAGDEYSKGLAEFFRDAFRKEGGKIQVFASYGENDVDFSPLLAQVASAQPEVLFLPDHGHRAALVAKQAREKGIQSILLGGDGWGMEVLIPIAGPAVEGAFFSSMSSPEDPRPEMQDFAQKYRAKVGSDAGPGAGQAYDATILLLNAIEKAKSEDPRRVAEALAKTRNFQGVTGSITIDPNGNAIKSAVIFEIVNGTNKYKTTVNP